ITQSKTELPKEFEGYYDTEQYIKSKSYLKESTRFRMATDTVFTAVTVFFIIAGSFNFVDRLARSFGFGDIITGLIFSGMLLIAYDIVHIPFYAYATFVIEEKYGLNKTTLKTFILDLIKTLLLTAFIGGFVLSVLLWFFGKMGNQAWMYCWGATALFQVLLMYIAPVIIMPLFNKFLPMEDGELKNEIMRYTHTQNFKIKGIFTMDGSRRSSKTNAFLTGIGRFRRIVLFDTLPIKHSLDELLAILSHEIGHYKKKHIMQSLALSIITSGIMFFTLSLLVNNPELFAAFRMEQTSIYASFFFFGFLYAPVEMVISIVGNILSRKNEYEADAYAVASCGQSEPMIVALKKLSVDNLSDLTPHPLKVFLTYSHPPALERIKRIRALVT
ncbi:MAG: M48 family metallopeptidase, partial [Pseudomonadota bacterium]